ncbi:hypothetical protein F5146DRAFT_1101799 [Armillaria mellea]|nr:hypothetical protein F5146DRAFT_1101799 [Armillaria mellea]
MNASLKISAGPYGSRTASALGHGKLTSPSPRSDTIGSAFSEACGSQLLSVETSDPYGNIQQEMQTSTVNSSICNLWLCKGYQFADNEANVQSYTAGQTISMTAEIRAPHTGVIATATNTIIGDALYSWDDYASNQSGCATAGDCVIQWYWYSESVDQTYEDCVDFTVGGSSDSSSSTSAVSASESATARSAEATTSATSAIAVPVSSPATSEAALSTSATAVSSAVVSATSASSTVVVSSISSAATSADGTTAVATSSSVRWVAG